MTPGGRLPANTHRESPGPRGEDKNRESEGSAGSYSVRFETIGGERSYS